MLHHSRLSSWALAGTIGVDCQAHNFLYQKMALLRTICDSYSLCAVLCNHVVTTGTEPIAHKSSVERENPPLAARIIHGILRSYRYCPGKQKTAKSAPGAGEACPVDLSARQKVIVLVRGTAVRVIVIVRGNRKPPKSRPAPGPGLLRIRTAKNDNSVQRPCAFSGFSLSTDNNDDAVRRVYSLRHSTGGYYRVT